MEEEITSLKVLLMNNNQFRLYCYFILETKPPFYIYLNKQNVDIIEYAT